MLAAQGTEEPVCGGTAENLVGCRQGVIVRTLASNREVTHTDLGLHCVRLVDNHDFPFRVGCHFLSRFEGPSWRCPPGADVFGRETAHLRLGGVSYNNQDRG